MATVAHILSGDACAPSNQAKMAYTVLKVHAGGGVQRGSVPASREVPVIVGITLEPQTASPGLIRLFLKRARTLRTFFKPFQPNLLLALPATMAYLVAILDSVAKGSALPPSAISELQIPVNDVLCRLLLLPRDIAVKVLHTPVAMGDWESVWLPVRSELNFPSGFLYALDCRSALTRTVLREQLQRPLPGANDDCSIFRLLCLKYQVNVGAPPHVRPAVDLSLPSSLVREPVLFVTTDAGHAPGDLRVLREKGGLGIVFSSGIKVQHWVSLGIRCAAGSSTVLEWLAKILALWMLVRAAFRGRVCLLCDNAAVQLCDFSRWVRAASWFNRLVKWVFQHPIALPVVGFWLPAQHDSGDTAVAPVWHRLADAAAPRGLDDADRYHIPWDSILGVLDDPPSPVCFNGYVVFKLNAFMDRLYDMTLGQSSALGGWLLEQGFDVSTWVRVCHDASVSLSLHQQAAYLRMLPFLPRVCRFCGLFQGNEQSHMCACVELYGRQRRAVRALEDLMIRDLGFSVLAA